MAKAVKQEVKKVVKKVAPKVIEEDDETNWISITALAVEQNVKPSTVRTWIFKGNLASKKFFKYNNQVLVDRTSLRLRKKD